MTYAEAIHRYATGTNAFRAGCRETYQALMARRSPAEQDRPSKARIEADYVAAVEAQVALPRAA
jgi:hypothetical protein